MFLCFKQNSEQYRHLNITYIYVIKIIFSFKIKTKADGGYLEFQKHISRYSKSLSTIHFTLWQLLLTAPIQNTLGLLYIRRIHRPLHLLNNTGGSRKTNTMTEFLFSTIYKPKCQNNTNLHSNAWYTFGVDRVLRIFTVLILSSFKFTYFVLFYVAILCYTRYIGLYWKFFNP